MKKISFPLCVFILVLSACSNPSSIAPVPVLVPPSILVSSTTTNNDPTTLLTYNYDGNKLIDISNPVGLYAKYTYDNDLITKIVYYTPPPFQSISNTSNFLYDAQDRLIFAGYMTYNSGLSYLFTYNQNSSISFNKRSANQYEVLNTTGMIYLTNNEVTQSVEQYPGNITKTTNYTYDSKQNPFKNITGFSKIIYNYTELNGINHNVLTVEKIYSNPILNSNSSYTYDYNTFDFPTNRGTTEQYFTIRKVSKIIF